MAVRRPVVVEEEAEVEVEVEQVVSRARGKCRLKVEVEVEEVDLGEVHLQCRADLAWVHQVKENRKRAESKVSQKATLKEDEARIQRMGRRKQSEDESLTLHRIKHNPNHVVTEASKYL